MNGSPERSRVRMRSVRSPLLRAPLTPLHSLLILSLTGCPEPKDPSEVEPAPESHVVVGSGQGVPAASGSPKPTGDYLYIAKRPQAIVGLADERGLGAPVAKAATDKIADTLDVCETTQSAGAPGGAPYHGAARVAIFLAEDGTVADTRLTLDDTNDPAQLAIALRCLEAPIKLMTFPAGPKDVDGKRRGFAVEATWGR